jgi:hypothetical protein
LYVTDYTSNPKVTPVQGSWCPPELSDRILKVEMWDTASQLAQIMEPGEYWFLRNARMKVSDSGYVEGTMQLAEKVRKLDENDPVLDPYLAALLEFVFHFEILHDCRDIDQLYTDESGSGRR